MKDVGNMLKSKMIAQATVKISTLTVTFSLLKNMHNYYNYVLAKYPDLGNVNKVQQKNEVRFTIERSLRRNNDLPLVRFLNTL